MGSRKAPSPTLLGASPTSPFFLLISSHFLILLLLLLLLPSFVLGATEAHTSLGDAVVMQAMAKGLTGPDCSLGWSPATDPYTWPFVSCSDSHVTAIQVGNHSLSGTRASPPSLAERPYRSSSSASTSRHLLCPHPHLPHGLQKGEKNMRVGVPEKDDFNKFVMVERDALTNRTSIGSYCIDVFDEVIKRPSYVVPYEYVPFANETTGRSAGSYDELIGQPRSANLARGFTLSVRPPLPPPPAPLDLMHAANNPPTTATSVARCARLRRRRQQTAGGCARPACGQTLAAPAWNYM